MSKKLKVLIACEYSGKVRDAFISLGHDALSCDILPTEKPGPHYQGDVMDIIYRPWDVLIAHPPCTYLTNSGVSWLHKDIARWPKLFRGAAFFKRFLDCDHISRIAVENPIMHKYAIQLIGGTKQTQIIQPWMFGHTERKATALWLKGLLPLRQTKNVKNQMLKLPKSEQQRLHYLPPSKDRAKLRSETYAGIAEAMAIQWGGDACEESDAA